MTVRERIPHTAKFLMAFHTAGGTRTAPAQEETTVAQDPFTTAPAAAPEDTRSPAQVALMDKLVASLESLDSETGRKAREYTQGMTEHGKWTRGREGNASAWIGNMISKERELRAARPAAQVALEDGMYAKVVDGTRRVFKVVHAVHGSGRQYAKELVQDGETWGWERAPGMVNRLTPADRMSLEEAQAFGRIYGVCCACGAILTDETSIAAGIGPVCASKF